MNMGQHQQKLRVELGERFVQGPQGAALPRCIRGAERARDDQRRELVAAHQTAREMEAELQRVLANLGDARMTLAIERPATYWRGCRDAFQKRLVTTSERPTYQGEKTC